MRVLLPHVEGVYREYTDVRDEMEFTEAESNLADLCNEYDQCEFGCEVVMMRCVALTTDANADIDDEYIEQEGEYAEEGEEVAE